MAFSRNHSALADATFSATGATNWNAAHALSEAVSGGIPFFSSTTAEGTSALLAANSLLIGGGAGAAPFTSANLTWGAATGQGLVGAAGTATTDVAAFSLTRTNNNSAVGTSVPWVSWDFTDTTSNAAALAFRIRGGASATTVLLSVSKIGSISTESSGTVSLPAFSLPDSGNGAPYRLGLYDLGNGLGISSGNFLSARFAGATFQLDTSGLVSWGSGAASSSSDSNLSRISAGLIGVGTGAAGSFAGAMKMTTLTMDGLAITKGYTVAALPAGVTGAIAHVTDQLTAVAAKGVAPTGGGSVYCVVTYNGAAWVGI